MCCTAADEVGVKPAMEEGMCAVAECGGGPEGCIMCGPACMLGGSITIWVVIC